jgi:mycoredoxin
LISVSPEQETRIGRVFTGLLGVCLLAAFAALIYVSRLDSGYTGARYAPAPGTAKARPQRPTPDARASAAPEAVAAQPTPRAQPAAAAGPPASSQPAPSPARPASSQPDELHEVEVTMYATPWCDICDRARDFLLARDVTLIEHDIDRDPGAARRLAKLNPGQSVPTFVIAGRTHVGFSPWEIQDALRDAGRERYSARAPLTGAR